MNLELFGLWLVRMFVWKSSNIDFFYQTFAAVTVVGTGIELFLPKM